VVEQGRKVSPDSRRYMCEATHENFIHPTQLKPIHFLSVNIVDDVEDDVTSLGSELEYSDDADDNNNNNNNTQTTTPNMRKRLSQLTQSVKTKQRK
jgi:hypothetical protein